MAKDNSGRHHTHVQNAAQITGAVVAAASLLSYLFFSGEELDGQYHWVQILLTGLIVTGTGLVLWAAVAGRQNKKRTMRRKEEQDTYRTAFIMELTGVLVAVGGLSVYLFISNDRLRTDYLWISFLLTALIVVGAVWAVRTAVKRRNK